MYAPVEDKLYTASADKAPIGSLTVCRQGGQRSAEASNSPGLQGLNSSVRNTSHSTFKLSPEQGFRWGTAALRLKMIFGVYNSATGLIDPCPVRTYVPDVNAEYIVTAAAARGDGYATADLYSIANTEMFPTNGQYLNAPSWNLVSQFIKAVKLLINGQEVYASSDGDFVEEFTARLIREYDWDALSNREDMLFTPLLDDTYAVQKHNTLQYTAVDLSQSSQIVRGNKWCAGPCTKIDANIVGSSNSRVVTKYIPFNDLFPHTKDVICRHIRSIQIDIDWVTNNDLLEHVSDDPTEQGFVYLQDATIMTDNYVPSAEMKQQLLSMVNEPDILPMLGTQIYTRQYTGNTIQIQTVNNFESLMILQLARGHGNQELTGGASTAWYTSAGQTCLFGTWGGPVDAYASTEPASVYMKLKSNDPPNVPSGAGDVVSRFQVKIGENYYPSMPIEVSQTVSCPAGWSAAAPPASGGAFDPAGLYNEYLKARNLVGTRHHNGAIPYDYFSTTLPFIYIRPFANDAPKLSNTQQDIQIMMSGGVIGTFIKIIIFKYQVVELSPDQHVKVH